VVPNASDNQSFESTGRAALPPWTEGKKLVLYTGAMGLVNDCKQMVLMSEIFRREGVVDIMTVLIGDGSERDELNAMVDRLGLTNIRILGQKPKHEVFEWLQQSSCSLMLVRNVGILSHASPNKIFDSLAAGIPVVQSSQGWIRDLFEREQCGLTVPGDDAEALARAVLRIVSNPELRASMANNARRVAREQFDRDLLAGRMRETLAAAAGVR
jgi:glycosyltransferase involved in cell wall biosynthesis